MTKPELAEVRMIFTQDGDDRSTAIQQIDIELIDSGAGKYYVIKTDRWAFDKKDELIGLLNKAFETVTE